MKFQPTAEKSAPRIKLVSGSLTKFVDLGVAQELHIGVGITAESTLQQLSRRKLVLLMRKVVIIAKQHKLEALNIAWADIRILAPVEMSDLELGELAGCAFVMANYEHTTYKTIPKAGFGAIKLIAITDPTKEAKEGVWLGQQVAEGVNACRELSNTPGSDMTPKTLAKAAKLAISGTKATFKVLGAAQMQKLGMGAVLGIGKGSSDEPQFIVMEYWGLGKPPTGVSSTKQGKPTDGPIVLVGKGVTFDTGGLNLKPGGHMYEMHMDMSGGAAVIHTIALAARLKLKVNVVGLIPAVENMVGAGAVRPGDMLKSLSGKMIEVLDTDAEGRVILADGITYAKRYNPTLVVDVATLTGASLVALGTQASAFMTNDESLIPKVMEVAEVSGDYLWPFPAWEEYEDMTKSTFGDIPNLSTDGNSRYGGVIAGGMFLREFAKELACPWIHIDMAPRMTTIPQDNLAKGAAGAPVRFLLKLLESGVK